MNQTIKKNNLDVFMQRNSITILLLFLFLANVWACVPGEEPDDQTQTLALLGISATKKDPVAEQFLSGELQLPELPAVDKQVTAENQIHIDAFQNEAIAVCIEPCVLPAEETDPKYVLQPEEFLAIEEHAARMKEEGEDSEVIRLKRTIINGNLYVRSILYSKKPADYYMLRTIREMDERIIAMPDELLLASVKMLTIQIRNRDDSLTNFSNGMYGTYRQFALAEIRVLIQLRRRFLDEIRNRN